MTTSRYRLLSASDPIKREDFGALPPGLDRRQTADEETRRDLTKSYEQLLADSHEEIMDPNRTPDQNLGYSNRRLAGIFARSAMMSEKSAEESSKTARENLGLQKEVRDLTRDLKQLTLQLKVLTIVLLILAIIQTYPVLKPLFDGSKAKVTLDKQPMPSDSKPQTQTIKNEPKS